MVCRLKCLMLVIILNILTIKYCFLKSWYINLFIHLITIVLLKNKFLCLNINRYFYNTSAISSNLAIVHHTVYN